MPAASSPFTSRQILQILAGALGANLVVVSHNKKGGNASLLIG